MYKYIIDRYLHIYFDINKLMFKYLSILDRQIKRYLTKIISC